MQRLLPEVISLAKDPFDAYNTGLSQPIVGKPLSSLAELTKVTIAAKTGALPDVP